MFTLKKIKNTYKLLFEQALASRELPVSKLLGFWASCLGRSKNKLTALSLKKKIIFSLISLFIIGGEIFNFHSSLFVDSEKAVLSDVSTGETIVPTTELTGPVGQTLGSSTTTEVNPTLPTKPRSTNPSPAPNNTNLNNDSEVKNENSEKDDTDNDASDEDDSDSQVLGNSITATPTFSPSPTVLPSISPTPPVTASPSPSPTVAGLTVNVAITGVASFSEIVPVGSDQCAILTTALSEGKIASLNMKYSNSLSTYAVYQINGLGKPNDIWWTYSVNGTEPPWGCSYIKVNNGDNVNWKYIGS